MSLTLAARAHYPLCSFGCLHARSAHLAHISPERRIAPSAPAKPACTNICTCLNRAPCCVHQTGREGGR